MSGKGWWNSAISGLESRLDTILAEESQGGAKAKSADGAAKDDAAEKTATDKKLAVEPASRNASRSRPNSRLQDRLAKAVNKGDSRASSDFGSRPESPALPPTDAPIDKGETGKEAEGADPAVVTEPSEPSKVEQPAKQSDTASPRPSTDAPAPAQPPPITSPPVTPLVSEQPTSTPMAMSIPSIVTPQPSSPRQSLDSNLSRPSIDASTLADTDDFTTRDPDVLLTQLSALQEAHEETVRGHRDELNGHLERIDALQSKLSYLAQQLATSAKSAATDADTTPQDKKLAEKDAQIAALMEEGQRLSKTEMKHLTTVKQLRAKAQEHNKEIATLKQRLTKAEKSITEQSERAKRAEAAEKSAQEKLKIVGKIEKDIELIRAEREEAGMTIAELRRQLSDALSRAEVAEKKVQAGALEAEKKATASLKEDIENLRIEKKLAEDRAKRDLQTSKDEAKSQQEKAKVTELELRGEIASKLELLRSRTEEATSSATGDSQAKLLRQIETLQTQYSLASENWQGIETSLTSRVAALEKDRDETAKRESDVRRKARDVNSKARRLEDELESINERARAFEHDLTEQHAAAQKLQARLAQAEAAAQDARADLEREKKVWEAELQQRLEDEKNKWKHEAQSQTLLHDVNHLRADSPSDSRRRHSPDPLGIYNHRKSVPRPTSSATDTHMPLSPMDRMFEDAARRPPVPRQRSTPKIRTPEIGTPQRQGSLASLTNLNGAIPDTPSIHTVDYDEAFDNVSSPQRTINDMISVSTAGAGPSVQLVERMSAAVRRLESEKATSKEELARLVAQRDEAREEVVALMREVEDKRKLDERVDGLESDLKDMEKRYETTLEMLGEKTERVEELEGDVADLKKIYKELVETMR
ncbi:TATA element modulatory factor 1 TATA binding-domain-containing protein [Paraphoma chrysanthemicola]|uniref:TATA element modulatory factor 1 TATA binding-domain-containing protein n=1 Tax=Paraphoma chrysanthemicola TaxID=798071 RepID=A0A8K0RI64_9PLEO|nr:TATA element modulatory factor 1 TATA binding-domain-containing protein [Paraphoma chrysanthemicola]